MSYDPAFAHRPETTDAAIHEMDLVTLAAAVRTDDGETVPSGTVGTVVGIWAKGAAFEVEFAGPIEGLATVEIEQIGSHRRWYA